MVFFGTAGALGAAEVGAAAALLLAALLDVDDGAGFESELQALAPSAVTVTASATPATLIGNISVSCRRLQTTGLIRLEPQAFVPCRLEQKMLRRGGGHCRGSARLPCYQQQMRALAWSAAVLLCAACGSTTPPTRPTTPAAAKPADAAAIGRMRQHLPKDLQGYEFGALPAPAAPTTLWGMSAESAADPPDCAALVAAPADGVRGWSASGPGGIVYATAAPAVAPAPELVGDCRSWTLSTDRARAAVDRTDAPQIAGARTLGMTAHIATSVENGAQTHSQATTLIAYVDALAVSVTMVTDPGAVVPPLPADLPATLLDAAVRSVRGIPATDGLAR